MLPPISAQVAQAPATLAPSQRALTPRLGAMILKVESQGETLGFRGWPQFGDLEAAERKASPYLYSSVPWIRYPPGQTHADSHHRMSGLSPQESVVWDNPRVTWFQDGAFWDAALLMLDSAGNLHLTYLEDAFGACHLEEVPFPEPDLNGRIEPDWVFKDSGPGSVEPGPDYADGVGDPSYTWSPKEGLLLNLGDVAPSVLSGADEVYGGFTLHREDLKGARLVFRQDSVLIRIKNRWWICPLVLWPRIAKTCHLPETP